MIFRAHHLKRWAESIRVFTIHAPRPSGSSVQRHPVLPRELGVHSTRTLSKAVCSTLLYEGYIIKDRSDSPVQGTRDVIRS